ncbi:MAG: UvrD-helicase domain-containing protein [Sandaracinaceae bacterium]|nr:UvrD-helicase domain-containing protein [Sandaracinaceae bacterium]
MNIESVDRGLAGLNPPQRRAVLYDGGPLVVFAGAGSGKTRVITHRVAHLVAERGVAPWNVLAVTFTNKAAAEMRERLERLVGPGARDLWVGTFHATCARLLRRYAKEIGIARDFSIYDDGDTRAMIKRVVADLALDERRWDPKYVAGRIARAKQEVQAPDAMELGSAVEEPLRSIYTRYEEKMRAANALDFGDLIYRMVVALETDAGLRAELSQRFRHLLVDEFQDTNQAQYRLVRALGASHRQLTVVGDDDQSIYRWRGADRRNLLAFRDEFSEAATIKLEQNYRSTQRILRAANAVITRASDREPKELWTDNPEGPKLTVLGCEDDRREAQLIVHAVEELRGAGRGLDEIAIFYRIHAQSRGVEEALRAANVPYRIVGGMRFYDRAEIKDLLAYLRVVANPADDVSLLRILNVPARGIGKRSIEVLLDLAASRGGGVYEAIAATVAEGGAAAKKLAPFVGLIEALRRQKAEGAPLAALGYAAYADSGYEGWLNEQDSPDADARKQNLLELLGAMQLAQEDDAELDLAGFLERVTLDAGDQAEGEEGEKLTLMTVHAAKGLEFPVVIVAGLEEDTFPFRRTQEPLDVEALEEERRLAYVALTRAEERLLLTWARVRRFFGRDVRYMTPSRFLLELPAQDVSFAGIAPTRAATRPSPAAWIEPPARRPRAAPGDSYVDRSEGTDEGGGAYVGMKVRHGKLGLGRIVRLDRTSPPRAAVDFGDGGLRTIQLSYLSPA